MCVGACVDEDVCVEESVSVSLEKRQKQFSHLTTKPQHSQQYLDNLNSISFRLQIKVYVTSEL